MASIKERTTTTSGNSSIVAIVRSTMIGIGRLSLGQSHLCHLPPVLLKVPLQHQQNMSLHLGHCTWVFCCQGQPIGVDDYLVMIVKHLEHLLVSLQHRYPLTSSASLHLPSCHSCWQWKHASVPQLSQITFACLNADFLREMVAVHSLFGQSITSILPSMSF